MGIVHVPACSYFHQVFYESFLLSQRMELENPRCMLDHEQFLELLGLDNSATIEEIFTQYQQIKAELNQKKEAAVDVKTRLKYQWQVIELDDAYLSFYKKFLQG